MGNTFVSLSEKCLFNIFFEWKCDFSAYFSTSVCLVQNCLQQVKVSETMYSMSGFWNSLARQTAIHSPLTIFKGQKNGQPPFSRYSCNARNKTFLFWEVFPYLDFCGDGLSDHTYISVKPFCAPYHQLHHPGTLVCLKVDIKGIVTNLWSVYENFKTSSWLVYCKDQLVTEWKVVSELKSLRILSARGKNQRQKP